MSVRKVVDSEVTVITGRGGGERRGNDESGRREIKQAALPTVCKKDIVLYCHL